MKKKYETPSIQIEKFDLKDPDIVASYDSGNNEGEWPAYYTEF